MFNFLSKFSKTTTLTGVAAIASATVFSGCYSSVDLRPGYSTSNCYWRQTYDQYGGYEQQYCWNPNMRGYNPHYSNGYYVRRYPNSYPMQFRNPRVVVTNPVYSPGYDNPGYVPGYTNPQYDPGFNHGRRHDPNSGYIPPATANPGYSNPTPVYAPPAVVTPARPIYNEPIYSPPRSAPPAMVTPPAAFPAQPGMPARRPTVPGRPKPDGFKKAVTVELPRSALGRLDLQGEVFANTDVAVHSSNHIDKVVVEAVISGPSESVVNGAINRLLESRKIESGTLSIGEDVHSECRVQSVDIVTPQNAPLSVRN